jgi:hypothetical protein
MGMIRKLIFQAVLRANKGDAFKGRRGIKRQLDDLIR